MLVETSGEIFRFPVGSINGLNVGTRVRNVLLTEVVGISFMECVKQCLKTTKCNSVNYMARFHVCEMNYKNIGESGSETISESSVIYTESQYWNRDKVY
ncbi:hypothetical protein FSP39_009011 [Pinctada imbricata]|uniref:Apple domain-containing protein n=1 Tax=Pinctada imbricata TaxID=66713 RepID=A0AA89C4S3_PINIB|nr:hypothetical protein FSP39_009011 [Pinctada imbricata]